VALAAALVGSAAPAQAAVRIPPDPLIVTAYFDGPDRRNLVGQRWFGCNQPPGSWGTTSPYRTTYFTPC